MKGERRRYPGVRRVALVSDSHGRLAAGLAEQLADADLIVHAGDVGAAVVLEILSGVAPVVAVSGNNDVPAKWPVADRATLTRLPASATLELPGGELVVVHGHQWPRAAQRHASLRRQWPGARCIVYGHSHRRVIDDAEHPWVLNPGACGRARAIGGAGWLGLEAGRAGWRVSEGGFMA
ncbi:MAG: metallophosphoesterase family protein [Gammaproteobacteria bacterium]